MLGIPKRLAQAPDTGAQIVQRGLVGRVAPKQRCQFPPMLPAVGTQREIGEQHPLALAERRRPPFPGKLVQLEPPNRRRDQRAEPLFPSSEAEAERIAASHRPRSITQFDAILTVSSTLGATLI